MSRPKLSRSPRSLSRTRGRTGVRALAAGSLAILLAVAVLVARNPGLRPGATATPGPGAATMPYPDVPRISVVDARARHEAGTALFVDVRSEEAFATSHIAGAISLPLSQLEERYQELPREREIITICT